MRKLSKNYDWVRFWVDPTAALHLTDGAFLVDPRHWPGINEHARTLHALRERPCVVLLGEQGVGKTSEVKRYLAATSGESQPGLVSRYIHLAEYATEEALRRDLIEDLGFASWRNGSGIYELFLDSLEESPLIEVIGKYIVRELAKFDRARLRLRIVCRAAVWPTSLEQKMQLIWQEDPPLVLKMAPLQKEDVKLALAAEMDASERDGFLLELSRARAESFAARPVTLRMLIGSFLANGALPPSQVELYRDACTRLCREVDLGRVEAGHAELLTADERFTIAGRLALLTQLGGAAAISTHSDPAEIAINELSLDTVIQGYNELPELRLRVGRQHLLETLSAGLFSPSGPNRVVWGHRTFAEFLAAEYLRVRGVPTRQAVGLLEHPAPGGRIAPQLAGTATWLAAMSHEGWRTVAHRNPDIVLASDSPTLSDNDRADLVSALLTLTSQSAIGRFWIGSPLHRHLCHPGLSAQLRPYLGRTADPPARREAIALASACRVGTLAPLLCDLALDSLEPTSTRREAIFAVGSIDDQEQCQRFVISALAPAREEAQLEVKAALLSVLWPKYLTTAQLLASIIRDEPKPSLGPYDSFMTHVIPERIDLGDLVAAYAWIETLPKMSSLAASHRELIDALLCRGRIDLQDPGVCRALARTVLVRLSSDGYLLGRHGTADFQHLVAQNVDERRRFLESLIEVAVAEPNTTEQLSRAICEFADQSDFPWLISRYDQAATAEEHRITAWLARCTCNPDDPLHVDCVLERSKSDEVIRSVFEGFFEVRAQMAALARTREARQELGRKSQEANLQVRAERIPDLLQRSAAGDVMVWPELNWAM